MLDTSTQLLQLCLHSIKDVYLVLMLDEKMFFSNASGQHSGGHQMHFLMRFIS